MNYLETLVHQWLDYRGYFVRSNVNVGRLKHGGHTGELDIAAYDPLNGHCVHVECSSDAGSWESRERRFAPKFQKGKEFILKEVFPWLKKTEVEQWAVVWSAGTGRRTVGGAKVVTLRTLLHNIASDILDLNKQGNRTIPEKHFLLRAMQDTMRHVGDPKKAGMPLAKDDRLIKSPLPGTKECFDG